MPSKLQRPIITNWPFLISYLVSLFLHGLLLLVVAPVGSPSLRTAQTAINLRLASANPQKESPPRLSVESSKSGEIPQKNVRNLPEPETPGPTVPPEPVFFSTHAMDRPPFPVSAPTPQKFLELDKLPDALVRLRLFIDANGVVVAVEIKSPESLADTAANQIKDMFFATSFVPGNIHGIDLPCYMDIELDIADYIHQR